MWFAPGLSVAYCRNDEIQVLCYRQATQARPGIYFVKLYFLLALNFDIKLVQSLKDIRSNASEVLLEFSAELKKLAQAETDSASRAAFVDACKLLGGSSEVCQSSGIITASPS